MKMAHLLKISIDTGFLKSLLILRENSAIHKVIYSINPISIIHPDMRDPEDEINISLLHGANENVFRRVIMGHNFKRIPVSEVMVHF
jgi:hypothetical protein